MAFTLEKIEALAPDQPSLAAARKLLKPAAWPTLAVDGDLVWGECQGSGATPYRVVVHEADAGYKCTCPSRKFPCKHSLALMWMRAEGKIVFAAAPTPEWVKDWLGRRRGPSAAASQDESAPKPIRSIQLAAVAETEVEADPKAEARAAAARERNRQEREAAILRGLDDLDIWLADQVDRGAAAFVAQCTQACRLIAQRLVDAKAPGLATRLDALPTRLFTLPEAVRPVAAVEELGLVYLIAQAYRRQAELPPALAADARQAAGWSFTREALLADEAALRVDGAWRVVATLSEVQPDRLRRVETWLWRESEAPDKPACAVLIDFVPVATGGASGGYLVGDRIAAELAFYPSAAPLRAQIVRVQGGAEATAASLVLPEAGLTQAFATWESTLAQLPWVGTWPLAFRDARLLRTGDALYLVDAGVTLALPLQTAQASLALPLAGLGALDGLALWNGYYLTLCWAETPLGRWVAA
ncbi:SWIM zinc finger [Granulicella rosea]|uniref:SWIM zinc finger n=1 Tax=Granulicella rosea TaxID=474952 RepID=A0A239JTG4_9BACT|nr:SWIM zinc finger family protein [Granulicella rosea]SNT09085.1 SWIM zinc finger [Granulicella rosea]